MANEWEGIQGDVQEAKGLLAPDTEYEFELTDIEVQKNVIVSKKAPERIRGKSLDVLTPEERADIGKNWTASYVQLNWTEVQTGVVIRESVPIDKFTVNPDKPEYQSKIVTIIQKLGYQVTPDMKIKPSDYIKKGLKIFAKVVEQIDKGGKVTGFHRIDYLSIKPTGAPKQVQQKIPIDQDTKSEIINIVAGVKTKEQGIQALMAAGKTTLLEPYLALVNQGVIKY